MKNNRKIVIVTLILFAVVVAVVLLMNKDYKTLQESNVEKHPPIENQPTIGDSNATVSIVEFGDYKCPACKAWGERIYPQLEEEFINTGKVKFSYINVLFHG